jgi:hypothetical protein
MDHKRFERLLPDFIENNLTGSDLAAFNAWLEEHPEAGEEVRKLRSLIIEVSDIDVPDPGSAFWNRFIPDLRTRIDQQTEKVGLGERMRRVVLRPAIIGSMALATVILALLVLYSNMGPRGAVVIESRRVNSRLEAALRGAEDNTLAQLEAYFEQTYPAGETEAPLFSQSQVLSAADSDSGTDSWIDNWLAREEDWRTALGGDGTYRLLGELETDELHQLAEMLRTEITAG